MGLEVIQEINSVTNSNSSLSTHQALRSINQKECYYMKPDKGNKLVILDKKDYDDRMKKLITEGPYEIVTRDPLPSMVTQTRKLI